jgi:type IV fimbrial biogenesis protein FimT
MNAQQIYRRVAGFTLVEVLVVVTIAAILASMAVPSLRAALLTNHLDTQSNQFIAALYVVRSEAIKSPGSVLWVNNASAGTNWSGGWSATATPAGGAPVVLQVAAPMPATVTMYSSGGAAGAFGFDPMGRLVVATGTVPPPSLVFVFCANGSTLAGSSRAVLVSPSGRVSQAHIGRTGSAAGIPLKDDGAQVTSCTAP